MLLTEIEWRFRLSKIRQKHTSFVVLAKQVIANLERAHRIEIECARVQFLTFSQREAFAAADKKVYVADEGLTSRLVVRRHARQRTRAGPQTDTRESRREFRMYFS